MKIIGKLFSAPRAKIALALLLALTMTTPTQAITPPDLDLSAHSALLMEKTTGTILYEKDPHTPLAPASVTKIMTILLVMEATSQLDPTTPITVSAYAASMGGSQVYLKEGETMSLQELLKCVVVSSANDASVALAEYLAGSETAFVAHMNQRAQELGMENTHFVNCTGLPAEDHYTTAYDIALMSRQLIQNHPQIRELTTIWMDTIRGGSFGLSNTNRLIRFYDGATGLKTGSTDQALYCMSATAERDGVEYIAVVMKAPTSDLRFTDAQAMLDHAFATYTLVEPYPDAPLPPVPVILGQLDYVQPTLAHTTTMLLPKTQATALTTVTTLADDLQAPVTQGQIIGKFEIYVEDVLTQTVDLVAQNPVPRLSFAGIFSQLCQILLMVEP